MKRNKINLGLVLCFVLLGLGVAFSLREKSRQEAVGLAQKVASTQTAIAKPVINAVKPRPADASSIPVISGLKVPVLMYHHVGDLTADQRKADPTGSDLTVSPADFETEVAFLKSRGYQSVSVAQVYDAVASGAALPAKPIVFTFDDGYKDVFTNAIPILQKYGYTGSFAIATQLLGRPTYGVWDDVVAAEKAGMEILDHTENHLDLTNPVYADYDLKREIDDSKQVLEQKLGVPVDFFVYPYGTYNSKVLGLVKDAGYKMAFTTAYGQYMSPNNLLTEPRVRVHGIETLDKFKYSLGLSSQTAPALTSP